MISKSLGKTNSNYFKHLENENYCLKMGKSPKANTLKCCALVQLSQIKKNILFPSTVVFFFWGINEDTSRLCHMMHMT